MEIERVQQSGTFQPVTLAFTFETQEELDAVGTMFNCSPVIETLVEFGLADEPYYEEFEAVGADIHRATEFARRVKERDSG